MQRYPGGHLSDVLRVVCGTDVEGVAEVARREGRYSASDPGQRLSATGDVRDEGDPVLQVEGQERQEHLAARILDEGAEVPGRPGRRAAPGLALDPARRVVVFGGPDVPRGQAAGRAVAPGHHQTGSAVGGVGVIDPVRLGHQVLLGVEVGAVGPVPCDTGEEPGAGGPEADPVCPVLGPAAVAPQDVQAVLQDALDPADADLPVDADVAGLVGGRVGDSHRSFLLDADGVHSCASCAWIRNPRSSNRFSG